MTIESKNLPGVFHTVKMEESKHGVTVHVEYGTCDHEFSSVIANENPKWIQGICIKCNELITIK